MMMEGLQTAVRSAISQSKDSELSTTIASTFEKAKTSFNNLSAAASAASSSPSNSIPSDPPPLLLPIQSRQVVSLWTCSKLCAVFFVAGVFVGYSLKRRVRRWASKLLRRLKDE